MGKRKEKMEIEQKITAVPIESIPFINGTNSFYLVPKYAYYLTYDGKEEMRYDVEVLCANLAKFVKENLNFKFIKDSNLGSVLIYAYKDGYYQLINDNEFKGMIKEYIPEYIRKSKDIEEVFKLLLMENECYDDIGMLNSDYHYINFKNGLLNLDTMEMEPHTPDKMFTIQIPVDYKPLDECERGEVFEKYMDELVSGDMVTKKVLLEAMGLVMSNIPGHKTKKCILMVGAKDCGKTQIKKLLTELIGIKYTSSLDLDKMTNNNFATSELYNKRLAGSNDMRYKTIDDMGIFKQLTGGDAISIEFKGKGSFSYTYNGFIWFLANDFPMFSGKKGKEIYERFLTISCEHVVEKDKQDPDLINKMLKEKEYIVSLCIEHLKDLMKRNYKFIESDSMKAAMEKYETLNNSLLQFVDECCDVDNNIAPSERLTLTQFKRNYQRWCKDGGIKAMKIGQPEIDYYLGSRYGTTVKKSNVLVLTNLVMNENFKNEYQTFGNG